MDESPRDPHHRDRSRSALGEESRQDRRPVALAEPDNFASSAFWHSLRDEESADEYLRDIRMAYQIERGKEILEEENLSLGGKLPSLVAAPGGGEANAWISDRAIPTHAPYREPAQKLLMRERLKRSSPAEDAFYKKTYLRCFLAAGGDKKEFLAFWRRSKHWDRRFAAQVREGRFAEGGATVLYMVSTRK